MVEAPQPNLGAGMKWFLRTQPSLFSRRHKLFGHLFSGRYESLIVEGSGSGYLKSVCDYVHPKSGGWSPRNTRKRKKRTSFSNLIRRVNAAALQTPFIFVSFRGH